MVFGFNTRYLDAEEGRLLVSLFYSHVPGDAGEAAYAVLYGNENPGIASKIPDGRSGKSY